VFLRKGRKDSSGMRCVDGLRIWSGSEDSTATAAMIERESCEVGREGNKLHRWVQAQLGAF